MEVDTLAQKTGQREKSRGTKQSPQLLIFHIKHTEMGKMLLFLEFSLNTYLKTDQLKQ